MAYYVEYPIYVWTAQPIPEVQNTTSGTYDCTAHYFRGITIMSNNTVLGSGLLTNIYGGVSLAGNV